MNRQALINFSEHQRDDAMRKYKIIELYLTHQEGIKEISLKSAIPQRILYRWIKSFEREGLIGLVRKTRSDFKQMKVSPKIREMTEDLVLRYKKISTKTLYRKIVVDCKENKTRIPSYSQIYRLRKSIPNSLIQLAHEGDKKYKETAEFCAACIQYKYIGICYGAPGVGKTLSSRYYCDWNNIERQIDSAPTVLKEGSGYNVSALVTLNERDLSYIRYGLEGKFVVVTGQKTYFNYYLDKIKGQDSLD